jgi:hypothetical protein
MVLGAIRWRVRAEHRLFTRFLHLGDNQAALAAVAKGRSSSHLLSVILSQLNAVCLAARLWPHYGYTETDVNPADAPSRTRSPG